MRLRIRPLDLVLALALAAATAQAQSRVPGSSGPAPPRTVPTRSLDSADHDTPPARPDDVDTSSLGSVPHDDADVQPDAAPEGAPPRDVDTAPLRDGNPDTPYVEPNPAAAKALPPAPHEAASGPYADWIKRLDDGAQQLRDAQKRAEDAEGAVTRMLTRNYPSGAAKAKLLKERDEARAALAQAQQDYPQLLEDARANGVPDSVLAPYEKAAPQS
jgi:hypothetical protein